MQSWQGVIPYKAYWEGLDIHETIKVSNFVITTGDFMQDRLKSEHADIIKNLYSKLNCPYYFAPGNADLTNTPHFEDIERFKRRFGAD